MHSNICIIPARGGSKRIPGKNLKLFNGKPIIQYSIEKALKSYLFDDVVVSTDDVEIAEFAKSVGARIPFFRPANLSDDHTNTADVIHHALKNIKYSEIRYDYCCVMYATAPFIRIKDLVKGEELLILDDLNGVIPITTFDFPIQRALNLTKPNGYVNMICPEHELTRSQDLPECYHDVGQFYWLNVDNFMKEKKMYPNTSKSIILPRVLVQDIDTMEDWEKAEVTYKVLKEMKYEI